MSWKKLALKLRTIVLSGAPLVELRPEVIEAFDWMRRGLRGQLSEDEVTKTPALPKLGEMLVWEPYSDMHGNPGRVFGWDVQATLYCADGKPWWLMRAQHALDDPGPKSIADIERLADFMGADATRDRIMNVSFEGGRGYAMWWTWINQHQLLEMHLRNRGKKTNPSSDMRVVPEGSPVESGWERVPRATPRRGASDERTNR